MIHLFTGTWIYIHKEMSNTHKDIEIEIIPGITSIFSFSAEIKTPIGEGEEIIGIIPHVIIWTG